MAAKQYGNSNVADADLKFALAHGVREGTASIAFDVKASYESSDRQAVTSSPANIPTRFPDSFKGLLQRVSPSRPGSSVNIQQVVVDYVDAFFDSSLEGKHFLGQIGLFLGAIPVPRRHDLARILSVIAGVSVKMQPGTTFRLDELLENHEDLQGDEFLPWLTQRMQPQVLHSMLEFDLTAQTILCRVKHLKITAGNGSFATEFDNVMYPSNPATGVRVIQVVSETASDPPTFG